MPAIAATIADTEAVSNPVDIGTSGYLSGLKIPAMTSVTVITVQAAEKENGTFVDLYDEAGNAITAACSTSAARAVDFQPPIGGFRYFKFVAGTGAGTAQSGAKVLYAMFRTERD